MPERTPRFEGEARKQLFLDVARKLSKRVMEDRGRPFFSYSEYVSALKDAGLKVKGKPITQEQIAFSLQNYGLVNSPEVPARRDKFVEMYDVVRGLVEQGVPKSEITDARVAQELGVSTNSVRARMKNNQEIDNLLLETTEDLVEARWDVYKSAAENLAETQETFTLDELCREVNRDNPNVYGGKKTLKTWQLVTFFNQYPERLEHMKELGLVVQGVHNSFAQNERER